MDDETWWEWIQAATSDDVGKLERFLAAGVNVNESDSEGQTALSYACAENRFVAARLLVAAGANVNSEYSDGGTPLDTASSHASPEFYAWLVSCGARRNWHGEGPSEFAYNNSQSKRMASAKVIAKRISSVHHGEEIQSHFVTFELAVGFCEVGMDLTDYSRMQVGTAGILQMQGWRYLGFVDGDG